MMNSLSFYWLLQFAGNLQHILQDSIKEVTKTLNPQSTDSPSIHEPSPSHIPAPKM